MDNNEAQMAALFEEGGIADDGMNVDPVSGNEIPPGSMASEVRDDVPAQLSEGEYVVPADVLRFYGVKFFEDLRSEAKQGLGQMEVDGRIGGEPVAAEGQQDMDALTPEEMAVLQEMGMAVGGMVPQPTQSTDPYMQQQQMYQQPAPVAMGNAGYDDGGVVTPDNTTAVFDPAQYGRGSSIDMARGVTPATTAAVSTVILYGPDGLTSQAFTLPAQQVEYDAKIAEGWSATQVALTTQTSVGQDPNEDYGGGGETPTLSKATDWSNPEAGTPEAFRKTWNDMNSPGSTIVGGLATALTGGVAGLGMAGLKKLQTKNMLKGINAQLADSNTPRSLIEELTGIKNTLEGNNVDGSGPTKGAGLFSSASKGNSLMENLANAFTPNDGASYVNGQLIDDKTKDPIKPGEDSSRGIEISGKLNNKDNDKKPKVKTKVKTKVEKNLAKGVSPSDAAGSPFKTGGVVSKRTKKKK